MNAPRLVTIDADYVMKGLACGYLRIQGDEAAYVETCTARSAPLFLDALAKEGLSASQVRWIIVTHVHLDHAGGASTLARACPQATVLAHPRAARHLIDPTKLVASAKQVYGEAAFAELYGTIEPIEASRVRALEDDETVPLGDATLRFLHTRGHANHHFVVHDPARDTVYTGDTFGLAYPRLQRAGRFAYPSTSPTDFDAAAAHASVNRILALGTSTACLTHFGEIDRLDTAAGQLHRWLDVSEEALASVADLPDAELEPAIRAHLDRAMDRALEEIGITPDADDRQLMGFDLALNAQGLAHALRRERR